MLADVSSCLLQQTLASLVLRKHGYAKTIAWVELVGKKAGTRLHDLMQLHQTGVGKECFDVVLTYLDRTRIAIVNE